jgi:hypothetical protein
MPIFVQNACIKLPFFKMGNVLAAMVSLKILLIKSVKIVMKTVLRAVVQLS